VKSFCYLRPASLAEAVQALAEHGPEARVLAGGTDLIVRMHTGHTQPAVVIDLKRVRELATDVSAADGAIRIGARAVMTDVIGDARIRTHYPALVEAASVVGSVQIRNRATLAGNICNASPAADTAPALLAYGAIVHLVGPGGERTVPLADFFTGPGRTVLARGELVSFIELPLPTAPSGGAFGRVTRRRGVDLATVNLVVVVASDGEARCAYGAVGPKPFLVTDASGALGRRNGDPKARRAAIEAIAAHAAPISDVRGSREYRRAMLTVMTERTWQRAIDRLEAARQGTGS
jgi:carbon-monoxide dehydrogenase medium subunit